MSECIGNESIRNLDDLKLVVTNYKMAKPLIAACTLFKYFVIIIFP